MIRSSYSKPLECLWPLVDDHKVSALVANHGTCIELMERIHKRGVRKEYKSLSEVKAAAKRAKPGHGLAIIGNAFVINGYVMAYDPNGVFIWSYFLSYYN